MPSLTAKMEYLKSIYSRYHNAGKEVKGRILEEFCKVNRYNRKYAIRLLNAVPPNPPKKATRRKVFLYSPQMIGIAGAIWEAAGFLCGQRLKEAIPLWLPAARERFPIGSRIKIVSQGLSMAK